jgi:hypothetical protein
VVRDRRAEGVSSAELRRPRCGRAEAGLVPVGIDKRRAPATRDPWMRETVHEIVDADPKARVLVLVGHMHLEMQSTMDKKATDGPNLFERPGLNVASLRFLTGGLVLDDAVADAGRSDEDLYIPLASDRYRGAIALRDDT